MRPNVTILGSGIPTPSMIRWGSSFVVDLGGSLMMFDCGYAATYKLYAAGFKATQVDDVFFTHHHSDHDADYPALLLTRFDMSIGNEKPLNVYGPTLTEQITERLIGEERGAFWHDIVARTSHPLSLSAYEGRGGTLPRQPPRVVAQDVEAGAVIEGDGWTVTSARVKHVQPYLDSLAYRLDTEGASIVFAGDTAPCPALTSLATDADLLFMDCVKLEEDVTREPFESSMSGTVGSARTAKEAAVKQLVLVHQSTVLDHPPSKTQAIHEVTSIYSGPVVWGEELMTVPWPRTES